MDHDEFERVEITSEDDLLLWLEKHHKDSSVIRLRPTHANHVWAIDFVHDKLSSGRSYKMLTVLDEFTRQALCVEVQDKMNSNNVLSALDPASDVTVPL